VNNVTVLMGPYTDSEIHTGEDDEQEGGGSQGKGGEGGGMRRTGSRLKNYGGSPRM